VTVRRLRATEWEAWRRLRLRALEEDPAAFGSTFDRESTLPDEEWKHRAAALAVSANRAMYVVESDEHDSLVASAGVVYDDGPPLVIGMWVAPEMRRRGLATALLKAVIASCQANGDVTLRLDVAVGNDAAIALYRNLGFVDTGLLHADEHRPDLIELEMERALM
jgi:ribosomal protein S18 acetylase RimI-like enzyme